MPRPAPPPPESLAPVLLAWFVRHGRRDLPWQQHPTPYRVWVSEIMLQQTQVATVARYYGRFLERFPSVAALAAAPLDEVLHAWSGLGYYARARNLHQAARRVDAQHAGELPRDIESVAALPGIGRSTAGAILALASNLRHPILDGNVKRVLARWFGVAGYPGTPTVAAQLWRLSDAVTPAGDARSFTQAIMDLGATVCTRVRPGCASCPLSRDCVARLSARQAELPARRPHRARPRRVVWWLVLRYRGTMLLERRPPEGIWGGLWGFPEFDGCASLAARAADAGRTDARPRALPAIQHAFTHFDLSIRPRLYELESVALAHMEEAGRTWYNPRDPAAIGLAAPVAALLGSLTEPGALDASHSQLRRPRPRSRGPGVRAVSG